MSLTLMLILVIVVLLIIDKIATDRTFRNANWRLPYAISMIANRGWKLVALILVITLAISLLY